jgi:guanine nucleotide-binding protein G(i) subunit alpha
MFVASLSCFDLYCEEDGVTNQMTETLKIFAALLEIEVLKPLALLLFFNKRDIFERKILSGGKLSTCFSDWKEKVLEDSESQRSEVDRAMTFIKQKFIACVPAQRKLYKYVTQATSRKVMQAVLASVYEVILKRRLQAAGLQ